jgi:hypothetical protein
MFSRADHGLSPETKATVAAQEPVGSPVSAVEPSQALTHHTTTTPPCPEDAHEALQTDAPAIRARWDGRAVCGVVADDKYVHLTADLTLSELAAGLRVAHAAVAEGFRQAMGFAITAGKILALAKERVAHGAWLPWLSANTRISPRMAQRYMRFAENAALLETHDLADLTFTRAEELISPKANTTRESHLPAPTPAPCVPDIPKLIPAPAEESPITASAPRIEILLPEPKHLFEAVGSAARVVEQPAAFTTLPPPSEVALPALLAPLSRR